MLSAEPSGSKHRNWPTLASQSRQLTFTRDEHVYEASRELTRLNVGQWILSQERARNDLAASMRRKSWLGYNVPIGMSDDGFNCFRRRGADGVSVPFRQLDPRHYAGAYHGDFVQSYK
jgi:hypothetical protein